MQHRRLALLLTALLIFTLVLSACGPRPQQGELAQSATDDTLVVDLPAVYIDYDEQGQASISGAAIAQLGALLGQDLSSSLALFLGVFAVFSFWILPEVVHKKGGKV